MSNTEDNIPASAPSVAETASGTPGVTSAQLEEQSIAFTIFANSLKRAKNLIDIDLALDGTKLQIEEENLKDAYRASIVLSISALDAYVRVFVLDRIKDLLKRQQLPQALKDYIKKDLFPNKETFHSIVFEPDFYKKIEDAFNKDFEKQSFQGQRNIAVFLKIAGFEDIFRKISRNADKSPDILQSNIEKHTQRRHDIVHCGDHDLAQSDITENKITRAEAQNCIQLVGFVAEQIHQISIQK
ncbi:MAG: hypothetical protein H7Y86_13550 [Rhizobacter sp.]|nr:hypothetical protein [Ferruginibacter sp.]